jgi:hypothetical protein
MRRLGVTSAKPKKRNRPTKLSRETARRLDEMDAIVEELFPSSMQKPLTPPPNAFRQYQDRGEEYRPPVSDE